MSEDEKVESSTTEEKTEESASAETKKTEEGSSNAVPYDRFYQVNEQKNKAQARIEELEAKLEELELSRNDPDPVTDKEEKAAQDLIHKHAQPIVDRSLATIKKELKKTQESLQEANRMAAELKWFNMCNEAGIDGKNEEIQAVFSGLSGAGKMPVAKAFERTVALFGGGKKTKAGSSGASVETDGVTGVTQTSDWIPKDLQDAVEGAKKGKRAKQLSSLEIVNRRKSG